MPEDRKVATALRSVLEEAGLTKTDAEAVEDVCELVVPRDLGTDGLAALLLRWRGQAFRRGVELGAYDRELLEQALLASPLEDEGV